MKGKKKIMDEDLVNVALVELLLRGAIKGCTIWEKCGIYEYKTYISDYVYIIYNGTYKRGYYKLTLQYKKDKEVILSALEDEGYAHLFDLLRLLHYTAKMHYEDRINRANAAETDKVTYPKG
jgi:hypothetical protein